MRKSSEVVDWVAALFTSVLAFTAYAGVVGLVGGWISFGEEIDDRLPLGSVTLAGIALCVWVALPMTLAGVAAGSHVRRADGVVEMAGVLLVGWIAVELAFIQTYSWFHPTYLAIAIATIGLAAGMRRSRGTGVGRHQVREDPVVSRP